jgi:hypothetical protein
MRRRAHASQRTRERAAPTPACPIRIVVVAALDNKDEPHDLPLAPWA